MNTNVLKYFRVLFLFLLAFGIFYALNGSKGEEVVIVSHTQSKDQVLDDMLQKGYIRKDLSYYFLKISLFLKGDIEPGGYVLRKGMGAASAILGLQDPEYRFVVVGSGQRKGEIAQNLGEELDWSEKEIKEFGTQYPVCEMIGQEGYLASGRYLIHKDEDPEIVQLKMQESQNEKLREIGIEDEDINSDNVLTIASLIQREASGTSDMRLISGIIWNRLRKDMPLQIDATLQYIRGNEDEWWPVPQADDKYIESQFNTYQNKGLPPSPIATPSESAMKAALNPLRTDCLYYIHDERGVIHCATSYEGHKRNVSYYLR
jgi:UPF0755 protein